MVWPTARLSQRGEYRQRYGRNVLQKLTEGASILGLFVMGVWSPNGRQSTYRWWFHKRMPRWLHRHHDRAEHSRPTLPWFLALGLTLLMVRLLNKKINPVG